MKVGITGTQRGWTTIQGSVFKGLIEVSVIDEFHHGDCEGVDDQAAHLVGELFGYDKVHSHPPENPKKRAYSKSGTTYPVKEYSDRNQDIVDAVDVLYVLPVTSKEQQRSGTWATYRKALKAHKSIVIIYPDGTMGTVQ